MIEFAKMIILHTLDIDNGVVRVATVSFGSLNSTYFTLDAFTNRRRIYWTLDRIQYRPNLTEEQNSAENQSIKLFNYIFSNVFNAVSNNEKIRRERIIIILFGGFMSETSAETSVFEKAKTRGVHVVGVDVPSGRLSPLTKSQWSTNGFAQEDISYHLVEYISTLLCTGNFFILAYGLALYITLYWNCHLALVCDTQRKSV